MKMLEHALNLGEFVVTKDIANIACYGLGSCVGLFIYDRVNKISGAVHVVLSDDLEKDTTYNAKTAFEKLIEEIEKIGGDRNALRAKFVGAANLFSSGFRTGERNVETLKKLIHNHKIFLADQVVGGTKSRTVRLNTLNGKLLVSSQNSKYAI